MAESVSRSMPAQNTLPAPVRLATRVRSFSISSRADCRSHIILGEMALRFSGRLKVMVAVGPLCSRSRVEYIASPSLVHQRRVGIGRANLIRQFYDFFEMQASFFLAVAGEAKRGENVLGRDVTDEFISGERAAAEAGEGAVKPAAACIVGGENLIRGAHGCAVQVSTDFHARDVIAGAAKDFAD